jgi:hypothetical protein
LVAHIKVYGWLGARLAVGHHALMAAMPCAPANLARIRSDSAMPPKANTGILALSTHSANRRQPNGSASGWLALVCTGDNKT